MRTRTLRGGCWVRSGADKLTMGVGIGAEVEEIGGARRRRNVVEWRRFCGEANRTMKNAARNFIILPCCLLLLNLCNQIVSYKARIIDDAFLRTGVVIALVLFGGSLVGFVAEPLIGVFVGSLHQGSRARWGQLGE